MNIYSDKLLLDVWKKAEEVYGYDNRIWRKDFAGAWIRYDHYGIKDSYGWEIDHKKPQAQGGTDNIRNLQPLQWKNNLEKSDILVEYLNLVLYFLFFSFDKNNSCADKTIMFL